jgi:formylglycine-generating enzyme required for sulfatase activity
VTGTRKRALLARAIIVITCSAAAQTPGPAPLHSLTYLIKGKAFARIPAGEFTMGSRNGNPDEQPPHRVRIPGAFEMGRYEVTQAQWRAVMDSPHNPKTAEAAAMIDPSHFKGPSLPVETVSWDAVHTFISILNKRDTKYQYRLPTEAEWEYAARAGRSGDTPGAMDTAWCTATSGGRTHPVGEKPANAWGIHDIIGNVMEWVEDWYAPDYYEGSPTVGPRGPASSSYKVYRGGAWLSDAKQCRPAFRGFDFPTAGYYSVGFRLVRTPR